MKTLKLFETSLGDNFEYDISIQTTYKLSGITAQNVSVQRQKQ